MISSKYWDKIEQAVVFVLYAFLVARAWPTALDAQNVSRALIVVSEGVVVIFLLFRRSTTDISMRPFDWVVALGGTLAPLLVNPKAGEPLSMSVGVFLLLFGMFTQIGAKLSLRRSIGLVAANRGVKTSGAYRFVRHPMYLGYMISHAGVLLLSPSVWNVAVYAVGWTCFLLRIAVEEKLLSQDETYQAFKKKTPFRLIPFVY